jgi:hypothetical protein
VDVQQMAKTEPRPGVLLVQFDGLAEGGFGFDVALRVVFQQVAEVAPRPGILLVQFDGLAVGGFGFGVALR